MRFTAKQVQQYKVYKELYESRRKYEWLRSCAIAFPLIVISFFLGLNASKIGEESLNAIYDVNKAVQSVPAPSQPMSGRAP